MEVSNDVHDVGSGRNVVLLLLSGTLEKMDDVHTCVHVYVACRINYAQITKKTAMCKPWFLQLKQSY